MAEIMPVFFLVFVVQDVWAAPALPYGSIGAAIQANFGGIPGGIFQPPGYQPPINTGYQPPINTGYQPPINTGYQPPINTGYQPPINTGYQPPVNTGYQPPVNTGYQPPVNTGYQPPVNTGYQSPIDVGYRPASYGLRPDLPNVYNRDPISLYDRPYGGSEISLSCETDDLECVPIYDCSEDPLKATRQCPPLWRKIGGACYFMPNPLRVRYRSQPDARQYCKDIGGRLAWIELESEKKAINDSVEQIPFWTDGVFNKNKDLWYWENDWVELEFKKLDGGISNSNPEIIDPSDQRHCLAINETGFNPATCYDQKSFVCKMGQFENRCEKSLSRCCWSPSYEYYYKTTLHHSSVLTSDVGRETKGHCFVLFNGEIVKCGKALEELRTYPTFRIEKSIYYLSPADEGCSASRDAIISTEEIHSTIVKFLMTVEKLNLKIKIGLMIKATDTGSTLLWVNGKAQSYYKHEHWAVGHPKMHGLTGCVMYTGTGTDGSGAYLWHTIEDDAECTNATNMVLCELPIRNTDFQPVTRNHSCGIRFSGGVLGRSYSAGNDYEEARFGEWPWQAAILNTRNFYLGVGQEFCCSGVLLSHDVVLTSAHCVQDLLLGTLLVSLGDYDLEAVNQRKLLEPLTVKVREVVEHPDYHTGKNDLAILHLEKSVAYLDKPHINVGCLPSQRILYAAGDWECFVTGWPQTSYDTGRRLQRVEVDFVPRRLCETQTRRRRYDAYGRPISQYQTGYTINQKKEPELLCVEPWDTTTCLPDKSMLLVCKKTVVFNDDPFHLGDSEDPDLYGQATTQSQQQYNQPGSIQPYTEKTQVINAYGQNKMNVDKYYVIGVGHDSNDCSTPGYMVFTPVHEYLDFIYTSIDETSASGIDPECPCLEY